ncbi:MAG: hypothetical protein U0903_02365 [Planctomycetales bacterium]
MKTITALKARNSILPRKFPESITTAVDEVETASKACGAAQAVNPRQARTASSSWTNWIRAYQRLNGQLQDLVEAKNTLEEIVRINVENKRPLLDSFEQIRKNFRELFRKLFGGGEGDVVLEDPEDVLDCGIEVVARPPGKELRSISLLSGGEKTLTAVALLMAIFKSKPSPFCILDEVDAALDEGNVERYMRVVQEFREWTQFIIISHSKRTMSVADVLYSVTMEESRGLQADVRPL